jgi:hypothetical protein
MRTACYIAHIGKVPHPILSVFAKDAQLGVLRKDAITMDFGQLNEYAATKPEIVNNGGYEHFMFAVRSTTLMQFCKHLCVDDLGYVGCDLLLRSYLLRLPCDIFVPSIWLYAKTMSPSVIDHASLDIEFFEQEDRFQEIWDRLKSYSVFRAERK